MKTKFMVFGMKNNNNRLKIELKLNNVKLCHVTNYRYLGVTIDPMLSCEPVIKDILKNAHFRQYQLRRLSHCLDKLSLTRIYKTYVLPLLEYGDILFANVSSGCLSKLQRVQNKCLRICRKEDAYISTAKVHSESKMPYLLDRRFAHQQIEGYKRSRCVELLDRRHCRTRNMEGPVLNVLTPHTAAYMRSLEYSIGVIWNNLSFEKRSYDNLVTFKNMVKSELTVKVPRWE